jgi:protein-tyrosine phosphatase
VTGEATSGETGMRDATQPYRIDTVDVPGGATLGLGHCPGRRGGAYGHRDLDADLAAIEAWGADVFVTLVETSEFARLGVPHFEAAAQASAMRWHHVPIADFGTPDAVTEAAWTRARGDLVGVFARGGKVMLHCAAGLGRTGTIAAKLLVDAGLTPEAAITAVRTARPGTIETGAQQTYVTSGPPLLTR